MKKSTNKFVKNKKYIKMMKNKIIDSNIDILTNIY